MSENSKIEWTDHTFNPWIGCTKVSPGCAHCYAESEDKRRAWTAEGWGKGKPRKRTSEHNWKQPLKWNRDAAYYRCDVCGAVPGPAHEHNAGFSQRRSRVFCASLADWLDDEVPIEWLADLLALIHATPNLDWLLLTKRPENFFVHVLAAGMILMGYRNHQRGNLPEALAEIPEDHIESILGWSKGEIFPHNVWIGTSVEDQTRADERIPELLQIPAKIRFLSCEPLLGSINFKHHALQADGVHWVIVGGESGPKARPMHPNWSRSLRDQCVTAGVPFFFKQWGEWLPYDHFDGDPFACNYLCDDKLEVLRIGKQKAGRSLEGRKWDQIPSVPSAKSTVQFPEVAA